MSEPVTISIVGTGSADGGGVAPTPDKTIAVTPGGQPDLRINVVGPMVAIAVRAGNVFVATLLATLTAGAGGVITPGITWKAAAATAGIAAALEGLRSAVTVFKRLEGKYPLLTGSI